VTQLLVMTSHDIIVTMVINMWSDNGGLSCLTVNQLLSSLLPVRQIKTTKQIQNVCLWDKLCI